MPLSLVLISSERFPDWLESSQKEYESDLIRMGDPPEEAHCRAVESMVSAFPSNSPALDNAVFDVVYTDDAVAPEDAKIIGYLWVGTDSSADSDSWWVWDILIHAEHRGKGFGRATMKLAEDYARTQGAHTLGLNVFGFNHGAKGLYESLGYQTVTTKMKKQL